MLLPSSFEPYRNKAKELIDKGDIQEVVFSSGTYQILMHDPKENENFWAFIQLDQSGTLRDYFCSCHETDDPCVHLTAAYLTIFRGHRRPLHQRFASSFWNQLGRVCSDRQKNELTYTDSGSYKAEGFKIIGKTAEASEALRLLIKEHPIETEETSLKFSELSPEEVQRWKEGNVSPRLRYLFSYWNDLTKWLMLNQDSGHPLVISFNFAENGTPNELTASFDNVELTLEFNEQELCQLIPSLSTIPSPIPVHDDPHEGIEKITYDKEKGELQVHAKELKQQRHERNKSDVRTIDLGEWWYLPNEGFYIKDQHHLLESPVLSGEKIAQVFDEHFAIIESLLDGDELHEEPACPNYTLHFDELGNLHINAYLFVPGDLNQKYARQFHQWVYLPDDGFYRLKDPYFERIHQMIFSESVLPFINQNRAWLNDQKGFETHLGSVETRIEYQLDSNDSLMLARIGNVDKNLDYGQWIYIPEEGFYRKSGTQLSIPFKHPIPSNQIPFFIKANEPELEIIPHFFSKKSPLQSLTLHVTVEDDETVAISPYYVLREDYKDKNVKFFEEFSYVPDEGFCEIPTEMKLPDRYYHTVEISLYHLNTFLITELPELSHWISYLDPRLKKPEQLLLFTDMISPTEQRGYYKLKIHYDTELGSIPLTDLWMGMSQKKRFLPTPQGLIDLHDSRYNWIRLLKKKQIDRRGNTLILSTMELLRLTVFEEIHIPKNRSQASKEAQEFLNRLQELQTPTAPNTEGLVSNLRSYQYNGVQWLWFLYCHHLSGLLCDEMGLGKTHQAMALIAAAENESLQVDKKGKKHYLIICPTSVIYHWEEKLLQFLPHMNVCTFHGTNRSLEDFHSEYNILLTSYGIWRNEFSLLSKVPFEIAIFDEVQAAKNRSSRTHHTLMQVNAQMRLGLTGTPIENYLKELKALFDLVLPGYMPTPMEYHEFFVVPIEKQGNVERRALLSRYIKPFILRRKKSHVLSDLPLKTEEISHCELSTDQSTLYNELLERSRQRIIAELSYDQQPIPYMHIFALLSGLKQICNHPAVFLKCPEEYKNYQSGKWDLFVELLNEARDSNQKVVIFSQYLAMLDIIQEHLKERKIHYAAVRGSTTDRAKQIAKFNHDPACEVFVGSLQAVGLGVDLTAGSVVIHYDRWWNAAREDQATDRVHRIGQTRGVQVFKLVTKGTFEERIDQLIARKGKLMEEIVGTDDHQVVKTLSREELLQLLQFY